MVGVIFSFLYTVLSKSVKLKIFCMTKILYQFSTYEKFAIRPNNFIHQLNEFAD